MLRKLFLVMVALSLSTGANALWETTVEGPDIFGETKAVSGGMDTLNESYMLKCDNQGALELIILEKASDAKDFYGYSKSSDFIFQIDNNAPIKGKGLTTGWNDDYIAILYFKPETEDEKQQLLKIIKEIKNAKEAIKSGIIFGKGHGLNTDKESYEMSAEGSTAAMTKFINACEIE